MSKPLTFLCISCYLKGQEFLKACKEQGNTVYLLTAKKLEHAAWPRESIDDMFYIEDDSNTPEVFQNLAVGLAYFFRENKIDHIVALDDFDVEKAAFLRETFRIPGMGQTTARYFRDKLAMRLRAKSAGIPIPAFTSLFHNQDIVEFANTVPAPWIVKPRSEASATGMKKVHTADELWGFINGLGEKRHEYLVEQFRPGDVYHADSLILHGKVIFCRASKYLNTPFEVAHGGGIFRSQTIEMGSKDDKAIQSLNKKVMKAFGMRSSASHTEFIKSHDDGKFYFLETSSRVGGAHLAEMVDYGTGINLWREWAIIETKVAQEKEYALPEARDDHAGILVSLSRFQYPDDSSFDDPEIVWRMRKDHHIGMILQSKDPERIRALLDHYAGRVFNEFHASAPVPDKPAD